MSKMPKMSNEIDLLSEESLRLLPEWLAEDGIEPITKPLLLHVYAAMKQPNREDGDEVDGDGMLICGKCGSPKQRKIYIKEFQGTVKTSCGCLCATQKYLEDEETRRRLEFAEQMGRWYGDVQIIRRGGGATFGDDNRSNPAASAKCRKFAGDWEEYANKPCGLLLYGNVGTGKSFLAECIKNALISKFVSALMTNIQMLAAGTGQYKEKKVDILHKVANVGLLILDDFGAEDEKLTPLVFEIIDTRCNAEKPLILTTNLTLDALENPRNADVQKRRIYDRVLSMCTPIAFGGKSQRMRKHGI